MEIRNDADMKSLQMVMHYAKKDIYENITQCLCLARIQLASINPDNKMNTIDLINESNKLIGKAVEDLRNLAKRFPCDKIIN